MITTLKTFAAAAAFATVGIAAQAATVAEISTEGDYAIVNDGNIDGFAVEGNFSAFLDTTFDPSATQDFLFELDLEATGIPTIDEEFFVPGISGDFIIATALGLLSDINLAFPDVLDSIIDEVLDGDTTQRELGLTGIYFGFDFGVVGVGVDSVSGFYGALLSEGQFDINSQPNVLSEGTFNGTATISTVSAVPLPATLPLLAFGGAGLMALGRRRKS